MVAAAQRARVCRALRAAGAARGGSGAQNRRQPPAWRPAGRPRRSSTTPRSRHARSGTQGAARCACRGRAARALRIERRKARARRMRCVRRLTRLLSSRVRVQRLESLHALLASPDALLTDSPAVAAAARDAAQARTQPLCARAQPAAAANPGVASRCGEPASDAAPPTRATVRRCTPRCTRLRARCRWVRPSRSCTPTALTRNRSGDRRVPRSLARRSAFCPPARSARAARCVAIGRDGAHPSVRSASATAAFACHALSACACALCGRG